MAAPVHDPVVGVHIDSKGATIAHWRQGEVRIEQLESDIPAHHRSVGHVHEGRGQHGGTGDHSAGEGPRLEARRAFLHRVVAALPEHDLLILGDSQMPGALATAVREADQHAIREGDRRIEVRTIDKLSQNQLVAAVAQFAGSPARRMVPRESQGQD